MKKVILISAFLLVFVTLSAMAVPTMINYQGKVDVSGTPFTGEGRFRFAIIDYPAGVQYWSNDGNEPPTNDVDITVTDGVFNVILGGIYFNMDPLDSFVFDNENLFLRVWFNDGVIGPQLLAPDKRITSAAYAIKAGSALDSGTVDGLDGADLEESAEIDSDIAVHTGIVDAHHTKTTSFTELTDTASDGQVPNDITVNYAGTAGDADTLDGSHAGDLEESAEIDSDIAVHAAISNAHHTKTSQFSELSGEAVDAQVSDSISIDNGRLYAPTGAGNVGIGTINPDETLHVAGNIMVNGNLLGWTADFMDAAVDTYNLVYTPGANNWIWQSFTAESTGVLTQIDLFHLSAYPIQNGTLQIYSGEGTGGTLLLDQSITGGESWYSYYPEETVSVTVGSQYTIRVTNHQDYWRWGANTGDVYSGGRASGLATEDMTFKTYISSPSQWFAANSGGGFSVLDSSIFVDEDGNVGIGTMYPEKKLHVNGEVMVNDSISGFGPAQPDTAFENYNALWNPGPDVWIWQSFTVESTGLLQQIDLYHGVNPMDDGTLQIYSGEGMDGDLLLEQSISSGQNWAQYPLTEGVNVIAGNQYTFRITDHHEVWKTGATWDDLYSGGRASTQPGDDLAFKAFVSPTSLWIGTTADGTGIVDNSILIDSTGNIGIGTFNPDYLLQVGENGDGSEARANAWNTFSDARWKTDLEEISGALDKLQEISGYYYRWIERPDTSRQAGVVAQEVETVFPEIVSTDSDGYKSVDYGKLSALLVEAVKELNDQVKTQEDYLLQQQKSIDALMEMNRRLMEEIINQQP